MHRHLIILLLHPSLEIYHIAMVYALALIIEAELFFIWKEGQNLFYSLCNQFEVFKVLQNLFPVKLHIKCKNFGVNFFVNG